LELANNIQVVFCVQGHGGSNLKLTNKGEKCWNMGAKEVKPNVREMM
jgi:hypothetical protein